MYTTVQYVVQCNKHILYCTVSTCMQTYSLSQVLNNLICFGLIPAWRDRSNIVWNDDVGCATHVQCLTERSE